MKQYRRKPLVILAEQFQVDDHPWPDSVKDDAGPSGTVVAGGRIGRFTIRMPDGFHIIHPGDWIIHSGRHTSLMDDAMFKEFYEPNE